MDGIYLSGFSKEDLIKTIKDSVKEATQEVFDTHSDDKLLTQDEACAFFKVSKPTLIAWGKEKRINPIRVGRRVYYSRSELLNIQKLQP